MCIQQPTWATSTLWRCLSRASLLKRLMFLGKKNIHFLNPPSRFVTLFNPECFCIRCTVVYHIRRLPSTPVGDVLGGAVVQLQKAAGPQEVQHVVSSSSSTEIQIPVVDSHGGRTDIPVGSGVLFLVKSQSKRYLWIHTVVYCTYKYIIWFKNMHSAQDQIQSRQKVLRVWKWRRKMMETSDSAVLGSRRLLVTQHHRGDLFCVCSRLTVHFRATHRLNCYTDCGTEHWLPPPLLKIPRCCWGLSSDQSCWCSCDAARLR